MEQWTTTTDTRIAAAFGTLGMVIRPKKVLHEKTGTRVVRYHIGLASVDKVYQTKPIQHAAKEGTLPAAHPFLTILRAMENRRRLLDLANRGTFCALRPVPGAPGIHQYEPADHGLPGLPPAGIVFRTGDLKLVCALGIVGLSVLHITGPEHNRTWYLSGAPLVRPGGLPPVDPVAFKRAWMDDRESIPWEDPFAQAMRGLHNRERLLDVVNRGADVILLGKGLRKVTLRSDATDAAWETAERFLG